MDQIPTNSIIVSKALEKTLYLAKYYIHSTLTAPLQLALVRFFTPPLLLPRNAGSLLVLSGCAGGMVNRGFGLLLYS